MFLLIAPTTILLQTFWQIFLLIFSFTATRGDDDVIRYSKLQKHNPKITKNPYKYFNFDTWTSTIDDSQMIEMVLVWQWQAN